MIISSSTQIATWLVLLWVLIGEAIAVAVTMGIFVTSTSCVAPRPVVNDDAMALYMCGCGYCQYA